VRLFPPFAKTAKDRAPGGGKQKSAETRATRPGATFSGGNRTRCIIVALSVFSTRSVSGFKNICGALVADNMDDHWLKNGKSSSDVMLTGDGMSFGGLLNNRLISKLHQDNELIITPWSAENLQIAQYALNPAQILYEDSKGIERMHDLEKAGDYRFKPHEYAKVVVKQTVILPDGIVGRFIPASGLIEAGFGLTAGKLDPGYGAKKEQIQFGIQNLRSRENVFGASTPFTSRVAYVEFFDIRTLPVDPGELREYDYKIREVRRRRDEFAKKGIGDEF